MAATAAGAAMLVSLSTFGSGAPAATKGTTKVGILQSLSGTMAISEVTVKNADLLAIEEINAASRRPRQEARSGRRRRRIGLADLRREGPES
jgi:ABC-type branched-subunit amino acid transport system substrate-binding protein